MVKIYQAIEEINPNAKYTYQGEDIDSIEWKSDTTPISKSDLQAKMDEIEIRDAHIQPRKDAYPSIQDQLDDIFHNGIDGWKETIQAVKDKYPKE